MMRPVTVQVARQLPGAPVLTFTRGSVILNWTDGTPVNYLDPATWGNPKNEIGYRIERAEVTDGIAGAYTQIAIGLANTTTYTDLPPDPTITYNYRVMAFNKAGDSPLERDHGRRPAAGPTALTAVVQLDPAPGCRREGRTRLDQQRHQRESTSSSSVQSAPEHSACSPRWLRRHELRRPDGGRRARTATGSTRSTRSVPRPTPKSGQRDRRQAGLHNRGARATGIPPSSDRT